MKGRWPTFLIVGAARSGTTALFTFLGQHPRIFVPELKEPHFFSFREQRVDFRGPDDDATINQRAVTEERAYRALFAGSRPQQEAGEASVSYLYYSNAPREIERTIPDVKIIAILRDPVERAFSNFQYMLATAREPESSFARALEREDERIAANWHHIWHYRHLGFYHRQLSRFFERFDREQILPLLYEDLRDDPGGTLASVFDFLGVDTSVRIDTDRRMNVSGRPLVPFLARLTVRSTRLKRIVLSRISDGTRIRIVSELRRWSLRREEVPQAEALWLRREYESEVTALAALIGRDLRSWLPADEESLPAGSGGSAEAG